MPTTINADTSTGGAIITGDTSGVLQLQSGGVTALTATGANVAAAGNVTAAGNLSVTGNVSVTGTLNSTTGLTSPALIAGGASGAQIRLGEATANGTNYAAIKAPDNLASNLTLTLPTADGTSGQFLQTNGSGQLAFATPASGTQNFTSSGSITAGQAVSINSNGTVSTTTGVNQSETWGSVTPGAGYSTSNARSVGFFDTNTSWHIHAYQDSSTGEVYVYAFKLNSSGVVSASNSVTLASPGGIVPRMCLSKGSTGNVYALMYTSASLGNRIRFFEMTDTTAGTMVSRNTISFGGAQNNNVWGDCYYDTNANRVVAFYNDGSAALGIIAINYNSNSPTSTATSSTSVGTTIGLDASLAAAYNSATNTGRVFYGNPSNSYAGTTRTVTLSTDGTTFTVGSAITFNGNNFQFGMRAAYFPNIDRFVVQGLVNSYSAFVTYTIVPSTGNTESGTSSIPSGTNSRYGTYGFSSGYDFTNNVVYNTDANGNLTVFSYTLSTSSIVYKAGTATTDSGPYDWIGCPGTSIDPVNVRVAVTAVSNSQGRAYLRGYIPSFFSTTADKFVGFSTQTVSTGQSVAVTTLGGVNTSQSGLTPGTNYYLQFNGAISTTPSAYGIVAEGLTTTSALVTTGGAFKKLLSQTVISGSPSSVTITLPSGYSQFELTFQYVRGGSTNAASITGTTSGGSNISFYGKGWVSYSTSTSSYFSQSSSIFYLTAGLSHSAGTIFGGSILMQSASSGAYWSYQMMTSFYSSGESYLSMTGYMDNAPASLTFTGLGTLSSGGVITLYGVG